MHTDPTAQLTQTCRTLDHVLLGVERFLLGVSSRRTFRRAPVMDSSRRSARVSISRFFTGGSAPVMHTLGEEPDGLSSIESSEPQSQQSQTRPRRRTSWFSGPSRTVDPMLEQHRENTFNASGADLFRAELFMPGGGAEDDPLPVSVRIGSDGIALWEVDEGGRMLRTFELETIVRWSKTDSEFWFSFSDDLGATAKKLRLRTTQGAEMVEACTRCATSVMEKVMGGGSSSMTAEHAAEEAYSAI